MAAKKAKPAAAVVPPSREELLELIWDAQARAVLKAIESGDASAAVLGVGRAFLMDNEITLSTLKSLRWQHDGLSPLLGPAGTGHVQLPTFDDDGDGASETSRASGAEASDDPLRVVPDFAPPTDDDTE